MRKTEYRVVKSIIQDLIACENGIQTQAVGGLEGQGLAIHHCGLFKHGPAMTVSLSKVVTFSNTPQLCDFTEKLLPGLSGFQWLCFHRALQSPRIQAVVLPHYLFPSSSPTSWPWVSSSSGRGSLVITGHCPALLSQVLCRILSARV